MDRTKQGVSRRAVVRGTAWAVPAVVVTTAAPAVAASPSQCITATFGGNSCTQLGTGQDVKGYRLQICFTNTCNVIARIHVSGVQGNTGSSPFQAVDLDIRVPANTTTPQCFNDLVIYCDGTSVDTITITFTVNGGPTQRQSLTSPPDCQTGTTFCA